MKSIKDPYYTEDEAVARVGKGWEALVRKVYSARTGLQLNVGIINVKESIITGGLRIEAEYIQRELESVIREVCTESYHTCRVCGNAGGLRKNNETYFVACDEHSVGKPLLAKPWY